MERDQSNHNMAARAEPPERNRARDRRANGGLRRLAKARSVGGTDCVNLSFWGVFVRIHLSSVASTEFISVRLLGLNSSQLGCFD